MEDVITRDGLTFIWVRKSMTDYYESLRLMYTDYAEDLRKCTKYHIKGDLLNPEDNTCLYYILVREDEKDIGFVFFSLEPYSFSRHDLMIGEFYIKEEYRKKGYGKKIASLFLQAAEYKGYDMSMIIIDGNKIAKKFWTEFFRENRYSERLAFGSFTAVHNYRDDLKFYYFSKMKEE